MRQDLDNTTQALKKILIQLTNLAVAQIQNCDSQIWMSETTRDNHIHEGQNGKAPFVILFFSHLYTFSVSSLHLYFFSLRSIFFFETVNL